MSDPPVHAEDLGALLQRLATGPQGLGAGEAAGRLARHGGNRLPEAPRPSEALRFLRQLGSPLVLALLLAAGLALWLGATGGEGQGGFLARYGDAAAILLIVVLNAVLGLVQEHRAESALAALRRLSVPAARVLRDGALVERPAEELVPGDVVAVEAGDAVPADLRLLSATGLFTEEAALSGESLPVAKEAGAQVPAGAPLPERANSLFLGTTVVHGSGRGVVYATGAATELGQIGAILGSAARGRTPLEQRLDHFGKGVLWACLVVSAALFGWGLWRGLRAWPLLLLEAVSFAVAAIPEGLPAITTITLALGMQRMAKKGVLVRKLPAVETLGAATLICSDKTGTLTRNQQVVRAVYAGGVRYRVSGQGYAPEGSLEPEGGAAPAPQPLRRLLTTAALCNRASLERDEHGGWRVVGDPTEGALLALADKGGPGMMTAAAVRASHQVLRELPFDSERRRMSVIARGPDGVIAAHIKGSLDVILPRCAWKAGPAGDEPLREADRAAFLAQAEGMGGAALRVLALAQGRDGEDPEEDLSLLGLAGMIDPPREGVREAIAACHEAGIAVVMITGDHAGTATAVARELGLWQEGDEALSGAELARVPASPDETALRGRLGRVRIFARTTAADKLRIVRAFKAGGEIVAMTGDGVNDAPALREAHIGVAMGRCGTEVARQAADVVITDDNFATIVAGVQEGRAIYRNIQKFIFYLLSSNAALTVAVFAAALSRTWLPLTPLMVLGINFVTNGLPALALGVDAPGREQMHGPPRRARAGLFTWDDYLGLAFVGVYMGLLAVLLYVWPPHAESALCRRTMAYGLLGLSPLFHVWNCRAPRASLFSQRPLVPWALVLACLVSAGIHLLGLLVPGLRRVFGTVPLSGADWLVVVALSASIIPVVEAAKAAARWWEGRPHPG